MSYLLISMLKPSHSLVSIECVKRRPSKEAVKSVGRMKVTEDCF